MFSAIASKKNLFLANGRSLWALGGGSASVTARPFTQSLLMRASSMDNNGQQASNNGGDFSPRPPRTPYVPRELSPPTNHVYMGNLNFGATERDIRDKMEKYGQVLNVRMPIDPRTQLKRGFVYVEYDNVESAKAAIKECRDTLFMGRDLRMDFATPRPQRAQ
jgi:nucleolin